MLWTATRSPWASPAAGTDGRGARLPFLAALFLLGGGGGPTPTPALPAPEPALLVLGVARDAADAKEWKDHRLGMGIRGRLVQMAAESGAFSLVEERELSPSIREALGGYWLRERAPGDLADLESLHAETGADWIAYGAVSQVGVTRDRVRGLVGGRRWRYRVVVHLCLREAGGREMCADGEGTSVTTSFGVVIEYRGDDVAFDQAGPAQAVDRALASAFNDLMPRWAAATRSDS